jgi:hypothetical protein
MGFLSPYRFQLTRCCCEKPYRLPLHYQRLPLGNWAPRGPPEPRTPSRRKLKPCRREPTLCVARPHARKRRWPACRERLRPACRLGRKERTPYPRTVAMSAYAVGQASSGATLRAAYLRWPDAPSGSAPPAPTFFCGWGGRTRTSEWRNQNPLPYRLATPQWGGCIDRSIPPRKRARVAAGFELAGPRRCRYRRASRLAAECGSAW